MLILGSGGLALQLIDEFEKAFAEQLVFWNDNGPEENIITQKYPLISTDAGVKHHFEKNGPDFIIAVGGVHNREKLLARFENLGGRAQTFIASSAAVSKYSTIGKGGLIATNAVIEAGVYVGLATLINTSAVITHECTIGDYNEIAPMATFGGKAVTGDFVFIGLNATVLPRIRIGAHCTVGAGAVVAKDTASYATIKGVPAK